MARKPAVAGTFYPGSKKELISMLDFLFSKVDVKKLSYDFSNAKAFVAPHAGYEYSGIVAAYTYSALKQRFTARPADTIVIIGPNHMGLSRFVNVSLEDWETPLGMAKNDTELSEEIAKQDRRISTYEEEIAEEHSIEVQVPFMQYLLGDVKYSFVCMTDQSLKASRELAKAIYAAASKLNRQIIVIASSDFNHYEPASVAEQKDKPAIAALERLDEEAFVSELVKHDDTACGYGAIATACILAKEYGAKKGVLLNYSNSGYMTGDFGSVVAYASLAML